MKKSFVFNLFFMVFVNMLIKPFWVFGVDRTVQNEIGEAEYGLYFAIFNFTYLFQILLDFGFQNYNSREVAADHRKINTLLPDIVTFKIILLLFYAFLCVAVAYPLGYLSHSFIWIILLNQILLSFNIYWRSNVSAHQHFITDALLSVLDKLLMIVFCSILIWGNIPALPLTVFNFAMAQLLAYGITFVVCMWAALRLTDRLHFQVHFGRLKTIAVETMPYAVIHFLMTTYYRIDAVMLEQLQGANGALESGIYAQGYRIMEALNNIGYLLAAVLLPLFAYKLAKSQQIKTVLKSGLSIMFCVAVSIIICLFWYRVDIIVLLYKSSQPQYAAQVFGCLLLNFFPVAMLYVIGTLLTANQNFRWMIASLVIAVVLNIVLNYYWIQSRGAFGAALATLATQLFMLCSYTIYGVYIFQLRVRLKYVAQLALFAGACLVLVFLLDSVHWFADDLKNMGMRMLLYFVSVPVLALLSGLVGRQTLALKVGIAE
ncbi:MAG: hypothetical protein RL222_157 [Bacteroidota bacterium]